MHMKNLLLLFIALIPLLGTAKDDKKNDDSSYKYLAGAITVQDGKIVFEEEIKAPSMKKEELYSTLLDWAVMRFVPENNLNSRIVYTNEENGEIVASAEEYMVFSSSALSLDRTRVYYHFCIQANDGACKLTMKRIRYWYDENRNGGEKYSAEEWITDDMALNKKKTKLAHVSGKFRRKTIDLKDELFSSVKKHIGINTKAQDTEQPVNGKTGTVSVSELSSYPEELAGNGNISIIAGGKEMTLSTDSWGGFGKLFNKDVAYILIDKKQADICKMMENSAEYTVSFHNEKSDKAEIVIECKKTMTQELSAEELKSLKQDIDTSKEYIMYICEVTSTITQ